MVGLLVNFGCGASLRWGASHYPLWRVCCGREPGSDVSLRIWDIERGVDQIRWGFWYEIDVPLQVAVDSKVGLVLVFGIVSPSWAGMKPVLVGIPVHCSL